MTTYPPARPVRVAVVDDQPLVLAGLRDTLARSPALELVGEAQHGAEAVQLARLMRPDVMLMDIGMPGMNGVEATRLICGETRHSAPQVLILTVYEHDDYVFEALRAGASGFLLKTTPTENVIEAVIAIFAGGAYLAPAVARRLVTEIASRPASPAVAAPELVGLTDRELDVFKLLVCGYRNDEIADRLVVGESTIKSHVQNLYRKIGVRDRVQAIIYAYERELLRPGIGPVSPARWNALAGRGNTDLHSSTGDVSQSTS
jgi:DNA-binding NarL/FixJ family response regulator